MPCQVIDRGNEKGWLGKGDVRERAQVHLDADPAQLAVRSMTVEHPYSTIKSWMGATHFKMRRLKNVATEMGLHVLAYNMTRVMNLMGIPAMMFMKASEASFALKLATNTRKYRRRS